VVSICDMHKVPTSLEGFQVPEIPSPEQQTRLSEQDGGSSPVSRQKSGVLQPPAGARFEKYSPA